LSIKNISKRYKCVKYKYYFKNFIIIIITCAHENLNSKFCNNLINISISNNINVFVIRIENVDRNVEKHKR